MLIQQLAQRLLPRGNRVTVLRALSVETQPKSGTGYLTLIQISFSVRCLDVSPLTSGAPELAEFREVFSKAKHIAIITGAGVSAESGLPTFRAASGHWRKWKTQVSIMTMRVHHPYLF